jgi:hypothetical protein
MAAPKTFPVLIVDLDELKEFLFSVSVAIAHDRATSVSESNEFGLTFPSPVNGKPVKIGITLYKGADTDWDPQSTKTAALLLYGKYLEIAMRNMSEGAASFYKFYSRLHRLRNEARASLQAKYNEIARHNRQTDDFIWVSASLANQGRSFGTLIMATAAAFVALSGAPAAGGAAGLYLTFSGAPGVCLTTKIATAVIDNGMNWSNAKAIAVGNLKSGEASVGEGTQKVFDAALEKGQTCLKQEADRLKGWATYLEENIKERSRKIAELWQAKRLTNEELRAFQKKLAEERAGLQRVRWQHQGDASAARRSGASLARTNFLVGKVLPVVAWMGDAVSEYSRNLSTQEEIDQWR